MFSCEILQFNIVINDESTQNLCLRTAPWFTIPALYTQSKSSKTYRNSIYKDSVFCKSSQSSKVTLQINQAHMYSQQSL